VDALLEFFNNENRFWQILTPISTPLTFERNWTFRFFYFGRTQNPLKH